MSRQTDGVLTFFGVAAISFMVVMYALEPRHPGLFGRIRLRLRVVERLRILADVWPFGVVEAVWAGVAIRRYRNRDGEAEALEAAGLRE